jgi:membrane carboxypeptidase/penicillin-binding protein PbpC
MRALARIVSLVAVRLLHHEWMELRAELTIVYRSQVEDAGCRPTALAQQLLISGEDHRFFSHGGIDPIAICRAIWRGMVLRHPEGASTIEMQVVRVVSGRFERTLRRKLHEMALATLVVRSIPKEALPGVYLRIGYFGWRMNGFEGACRRLGLTADSLTPAQTAGLVARLKYPQPRATRPERWNQINARAQHLLRLHSRHERDHTYAGLMVAPRYESV